MKKKKIILLVGLFFLILTTTGCVRILEDEDGNRVQNEVTGQNLTDNILCRPTDPEIIKLYEDAGTDLSELPECSDLTITSGSGGIWENVFIVPLAFLLITVGGVVGSYALATIIVSIAIRVVLLPVSIRAMKSTQGMRKAQPEIQKMQKKYEGKTDQESRMKQSQEMMAIWKKYKINPVTGCLMAFIQLPIFMAFFGAIQRLPVLFEEKVIGLQLGTTPAVGISSSTFYMYIILVALIGLTTYFSFKMTMAPNASAPGMEKQMKMMPQIMTVMIIVMSAFMPTALGIMWVSTNIFIICQNTIIQRKSKFPADVKETKVISTRNKEPKVIEAKVKETSKKKNTKNKK